MKINKKAIISIIMSSIFMMMFSQITFAGNYEAYTAQLTANGILDENIKIPYAKDIPMHDFLMYSIKNSNDFNKNAKYTNQKEKFNNVSNIMTYSPYVYTALNLGLIEMPEDRTFKGKATITKIEGLKMIFDIYGINTPKLLKLNKSYNDVSENASYIPIITTAIKLNLIDEESQNHFGVTSNLTYGDLIQILGELNIVIANQKQPTEKLILPLDEPDIENLDILYDVYDKINQFYFYDEELDNKKMMQSAISGLVNSLDDRYSVYNTPNETEDFIEENSGEFEGVGMWIEKEAGEYIQVAGVVPDSPAEIANLKVGDIILKVNGEDIAGWSPQKVANNVKGEAGTTVKLRILKHTTNRQVTVIVERAKIDISFVTGEILENKYAYIDISQFPEDLDKDFTKIANNIINSNTKGIILDLRNNPGGYIYAAEDLLGHFLEKGSSMYYLDYKSGDRAAKSHGEGELKDIPLVVLIDASSASAAEIVTAALQDHNAATIVGVQSFGKGVAQQLFFYDDGSSLKLTIAEWLSPNKTRLNKIGVTPDYIISDNEASETDEILRKGLHLLKTNQVK